MAQAKVLGSAARGARWWLLAWFLLWWVVMAGGGVWFAILPVLNLLTVALTILIWPRGEPAVGSTLVAIIDGLVIAYAIAAMGALGALSVAMMAWAVVCFAGGWLILRAARARAEGAVGEVGEAVATGLVRRTTALAVLLMFAGGVAGQATLMVRAAPTERAYQVGVERLLRDNVFAAPQPLTWERGLRAYVRPDDRGKGLPGFGDHYIVVEAQLLHASSRHPDPSALRTEVRVSLGTRCLPLKDHVYTPEELVALGIFTPGFARAMKPDRRTQGTGPVMFWRGSICGGEVSYVGLGPGVDLTFAGPLP